MERSPGIPDYGSLARIVLAPGEGLPVRETWALHNVDLLYLEAGEVVVVDIQRRTQETWAAGSRITFPPDPNGSKEIYRYGLRNDGSQPASLLRVNYGGTGAQGKTIEYPQFGTDDPRFLVSISASYGLTLPDAPSGNSIVFLARLDLEPGVDLGTHTHTGPIGLWVESGTLTFEHPAIETLLDAGFSGNADREVPIVPTGEPISLTPGGAISVPRFIPHRVANTGESTLSLLVIGVVDSTHPFIGRFSALEIHSSICPSGYSGTDYYGACHDTGREGAQFVIVGDDGYEAEGLTSTYNADGAAWPGIIRFGALQAGEFWLREPSAAVGDSMSLYCSMDGEPLGQYDGPATDTVVIDVPAASYVVCDWYTIPNG